MTVLDLFSGIGGFSLGLQRAGFVTAAFCESGSFARNVLRRHWPDVPCYPDVRMLSAERLRRDGVPMPGLVCGGFPCQDISAAGLGAGIDGSRSALWWDMLRLVQECRPGWVVVENVPALRVRGADAVLAGLEAAGYTCWPLLVGAAHAGAPHRRQRVFLVAHATRAGLAGGLCQPAWPPSRLPPERRRGWPAEPGLGRVVDGLPAGLERVRRARVTALGNAIVPDVAEAVGWAIRSAQAAAQPKRSADASPSKCGVIPLP